MGTDKKPRASVFRSAKGIYIQLIDDSNGKTVVWANSREIKSKNFDIELAKEVGKLLAQKAKKAKIAEVIFDRGGYRYHGKVKALADGMREGGLKF